MPTKVSKSLQRPPKSVQKSLKASITTKRRPKWSQMFHNGLKCFQNGPKWCQMLPNGAKCIFIKFSWFVMHFKRSSLNIFTHRLFNQRKKIPKKHWSSKNFFTVFFLLFRKHLFLFFNMVQKGLKISKMSLKMFQNRPKWSNMVQKPPKTSESL